MDRNSHFKRNSTPIQALTLHLQVILTVSPKEYKTKNTTFKFGKTGIVQSNKGDSGNGDQKECCFLITPPWNTRYTPRYQEYLSGLVRHF
jgi:hypothetical protein